MPIDTYPFIKNMNTGIPSNQDPRAEGAAQLRAIKTVVKNSFPEVDGPVEADHNRMNSVFQTGMPELGMIMMFAGSKAPDGWAFCDGGIYNNKLTPDLRGRFIMGSNIEYDKTRPIVDTETGEVRSGGKGGSNFEKDFGKYIKSKGHKLTVDEMPSHDHEINMTRGDKGRSSGSQHRVTPTDSKTGKTGGDKEHAHEIEHKPKPSKPEEKVVYDKRPSWYALAFIMYVGFPSI